MHPRLALNSLSTASWPLDQELQLFVDLGVPRAGLFLDKLVGAGDDRAIQMVRDAGLEVTEVTCRGVTPSQPERWPEDRARLLHALEFARVFGAPFVSVTTGPAGALSWDEAAAGLGEALAPVVAAASEAGVGVAIEQTIPIRPDVGFVHSLRDTVELARRFGLGAILEAHYCFAERGIDDTLRSSADVVAVVQLSDLVPPCEAVLDRAVPGDGIIPLERLVRTLVQSGYAGVFELEMLGPRIEAEGYASACRRGVAHLDAVLAAAGA